MPVIYPKKIRQKFNNIDLELLKKAIIEDGFEFVRDGGFRPEDEPFKYSNYLFYTNKSTGESLRVGYNYPLFGKDNKVFEIMYAGKGCTWWTDVTPDMRKAKWRKVMRNLN